MNSSCPQYPIAGKNVAAEIQAACLPNVDGNYVNKCPNTFEWLDRVERLKNKLDACNKR